MFGKQFSFFSLNCEKFVELCIPTEVKEFLLEVKNSLLVLVIRLFSLERWRLWSCNENNSCKHMPVNSQTTRLMWTHPFSYLFTICECFDERLLPGVLICWAFLIVLVSLRHTFHELDMFSSVTVPENGEPLGGPLAKTT